MLTAQCLSADEVHLKNGSVVDGKVTEVGDTYHVVNDDGSKAIIPKSKVDRLVKKMSNLEIYQIELKRLKTDDFEGHMRLGTWCRKVGLPDKAEWHFTTAVALKPGDTKALLAAGYVRKKGKWIRYSDYMRSQGMERYKGKWVTEAEATKSRIKDKRQAAQAETFSTVWKLFFSVGRLKDDASLKPVVETIVANKNAALGATERASYGTRPRMREAALYVLGHFDCEQSRSLLLARLDEERDERLFRICAWQLAYRRDRPEVMKILLEKALKDRSAKRRRRVHYALSLMQDPMLIEILLEYADFCPVEIPEEPEEGQTEMADGQLTKQDATSQTIRSRPQKPYYPGAEALRALTNEIIRPEKDVWKKWWQLKKASFVFKTPQRPVGMEYPAFGTPLPARMKPAVDVPPAQTPPAAPQPEALQSEEPLPEAPAFSEIPAPTAPSGPLLPGQ